MRIAILSDSHDHFERLEAAVAGAKASGAEAVLHCGDIVSPNVLKGLPRFGLPLHLIHGNNQGDLVTLMGLVQRHPDIFRYHGQDADIRLGERRIFMVHYPHYGHAMALTGDYDLVCCGHEHVLAITWVENIRGGRTLLINPGTVAGISAPATYVLCDLETLRCEVRELRG
ncbi:MAG: YfcE family phosphodiesterase [Gammaproteobacteria bacterium]|nr:MAG: YfcE family phosphodiesterase [Gammaproteobacteria bacterium]